MSSKIVNMIGRLLGRVLGCWPFVLSVFIGVYVPWLLAGAYYNCSKHDTEQAYLNECTFRLIEMRIVSRDQELRDILTYTIDRYNTVGGYDVAFLPLAGLPSEKVLGANLPWVPGVTLDTSCLLDKPDDTALILVHEALHDYWPYLGHEHITERMERMYELSRQLDRVKGGQE